MVPTNILEKNGGKKKQNSREKLSKNCVKVKEICSIALNLF